MSETVFANGMFIQERKPQTPEFVLGKFSIKVDEFMQTLQQYKNSSGYVNIQMLRSKSGKPYLAIDTYGLDKQQNAPATDQQVPGLPAQDGFANWF